ncbi:MAG: hypothetical protein K2U26_07830 [Cyclobacteriaceae bacterium]|nr:hypothetical protein [Cyclobacteriaceae bacterium]
MSSYTVTLTNAASEQAFLEFLETHTGVKAVANDPSVFDANGNFQRVNLASDGLPISPEYLAWRLNQSMESGSISKEDFLIELEKRKSSLVKK